MMIVEELDLSITLARPLSPERVSSKAVSSSLSRYFGSFRSLHLANSSSCPDKGAAALQPLPVLARPRLVSLSFLERWLRLPASCKKRR